MHKRFKKVTGAAANRCLKFYFNAKFSIAAHINLIPESRDLPIEK